MVKGRLSLLLRRPVDDPDDGQHHRDFPRSWRRLQLNPKAPALVTAAAICGVDVPAIGA
jgi:hypothetical protein